MTVLLQDAVPFFRMTFLLDASLAA